MDRRERECGGQQLPDSLTMGSRMQPCCSGDSSCLITLSRYHPLRPPELSSSSVVVHVDPFESTAPLLLHQRNGMLISRLYTQQTVSRLLRFTVPALHAVAYLRPSAAHSITVHHSRAHRITTHYRAP